MDKIIRGRAWVVRDGAGNPIENIDTDMIFHNKHLAITDIGEMGQHAFGNLEGWRDFPKKAQKGDILVVGKNFGAGSSRQQAVDCFIALGIRAIIGESFGAIYFRNAVNAGLPILEAPGIASAEIASGDEIEIEAATGAVRNITRDAQLPPAKPVFSIQREIIEAGGLLELARKILGDEISKTPGTG